MLHLLVILLTCASAIPFLDEEELPGGFFNNRREPPSWLSKATKNWMGDLPDTTDLRKVSIPGTHDSGADVGGILCETQSWSIPTQLENGIRYFDIRARRDRNVFTIHHGICYLFMSYSDVVRDFKTFLAQHPKEGIIMRLKEEYEPAPKSNSFAQIWERYYNSDKTLYVQETNGKVPNLGDIRGKILVLRNADFGKNAVGLKYDGALTSIQDFYKVYGVLNDSPFGEDTVSLRQKMRLVVEFIQKALDAKSLYLNHLSGANGLLPADVARSTNQAGYDAIGRYNTKKSTGIVIMDYPGARLIYRVIKTNFSPSEEDDNVMNSVVMCASQTWRVASDMTWAEFRMPKSHVGREIFIRKGAYGIYRFPKFHRVWWTDLEFVCGEDGTWKLNGKFDADGLCCSSNTAQLYLEVGNRSLIRQIMWLWGPAKRLMGSLSGK